MAIYKVDKSWRAEISFKDPLTGKYRKKGKRGFKTKKEAEAWVAQYSINNGKPTLQKGSITYFKDYFNDYRKLHFESRDLKEATYVAWDAVEKYIVNVIFLM